MFNKNLGPKAPLFRPKEAKNGKVPFRPEPFFGEKRVFSGRKNEFCTAKFLFIAFVIGGGDEYQRYLSLYIRSIIEDRYLLGSLLL